MTYTAFGFYLFLVIVLLIYYTRSPANTVGDPVSRKRRLLSDCLPHRLVDCTFKRTAVLWRRAAAAALHTIPEAFVWLRGYPCFAALVFY